MKIGNTKKSWSKWGGIGSKLLKLDEEWSCQACADKIPLAIDPFLIPFDTGGIANEYLRICPSCYYKTRVFKITYYELVKVVRN